MMALSFVGGGGLASSSTVLLLRWLLAFCALFIRTADSRSSSSGNDNNGVDDAFISSGVSMEGFWSAALSRDVVYPALVTFLCIALSLSIVALCALQGRLEGSIGEQREWKAENDAMGKAERAFEREWAAKRKKIIGSKEYSYVKGESVRRLLQEEWALPESVSAELGHIFDLLCRDFIFSWYGELQTYPETDHGLIGDIQALYVQATGIICRRLLSMNLIMFLLGKTTDVLRRHLLWYHEMRREAKMRNPAAFRDEDDISEEAYERRNALIMDEFRRAKFSFHPACRARYNQGRAEAEHLRRRADRILRKVLSRKDKTCSAFVRLVREILVARVLGPAMSAATPHELNTIALKLLSSSDEKEVQVQEGDNKPLPRGGILASDDDDEGDFCESNTNTNAEEDDSIIISARASPAAWEDEVVVEDAEDDLKAQTHSKLVLSTQKAVDGIITEFLRNPNSKIRSSNGACQKLIAAIEAVFLHGLRPIPGKKAKYWRYVKHTPRVLPAAAMMISSIEVGEKVSIRDVHAKGEQWGPGRAWLYMCLNHKTLPEHVEALINNKELTRDFYTNDSVFTDPPRAQEFVALCAGANGVNFEIEMAPFWDACAASSKKTLRRKGRRVVDKIKKKLSPFPPKQPAPASPVPIPRFSDAPLPSESGMIQASGPAAIRAVVMNSTPKQSAAPSTPPDANGSVNSWLGAAAAHGSLSPSMRPSPAVEGAMPALHLQSFSDAPMDERAASIGGETHFDNVEQWKQNSKRGDTRDALRKSATFDAPVRVAQAIPQSKRTSRSSDNAIAKTGKFVADALRLEWLLGRGGIDVLFRDVDDLDKALEGAFNIPGKTIRAKVVAFEIKATSGQIFDSRPHVEYKIECSTLSSEDGGGRSGKSKESVVSWSIWRRYNTFHVLHKRLKAKYSRMRCSLPKKKAFRIFGKFDQEFVEKRRSELHEYLNQVLDDPNVSDSKELRIFLSPDSQLDIVTAPLRRSNKGSSRSRLSISDSEMDAARDVRDVASPAVENRGRGDSGARRSGGDDGSGKPPKTPVTKRLKKIATSAAAAGRRRSSYRRERRRAKVLLKARKVTKVRKRKILREDVKKSEIRLFSLVDEIFRFRSMGLLRRNIAGVAKSVVRYSFHGTFRKWLYENFHRDESSHTSRTTYFMLHEMRELLWPNGVRAEDTGASVHEDEIVSTRREVKNLLQTILPAGLIAIIGRGPVNAGWEKAHDFTQNPKLVKNFLFEVLDLLLVELFPRLTIDELRGETVPR